MPISSKALIFDMDGTLFDTEPLHRQAWRKIFGQFDIHLSDEDIIRFNGSSPENVAQKLIQENHLDLNPIDIATQKKEMVEHIFTYEPINPLPAASLLEQVYGQYRIALGTGSNTKTVQILLQRFNCLNFFETIISADHVTRHKPDPDTFLQCAQQLNVEPSSCIVFEDSLFGIQAGKNAGMNVIDVNDKTLYELQRLLTCID